MRRLNRVTQIPKVRKPRRWNGWRCIGCNHVHAADAADPCVPPTRCVNGCVGRGWHRRADPATRAERLVRRAKADLAMQKLGQDLRAEMDRIVAARGARMQAETMHAIAEIAGAA